ncbi:MAG: DegT/DnrJ/EryC1/StrS aminotransferase family protein [Oscillospiraceae bacterium]|nr:DegT/DnrJ/EryC1/StrS aminotransferase family protein [Oscillospiraceae bacterium]MDD4367934.1 DegT/DnrJ/EryC1/StrS aminotransferase family protein [Oscillospiraceae bacterium]
MKKIPFSPPDIREEDIQAVTEALRSGWITTGPRTKAFERELSSFCGTLKTACLNSATAALELTLRLLGIRPGDEVITSAYTYTASASVIHHVGATIVLVDTAPDSFELDYEQVAAKLNSKTKAVIPVDIGGMMADYKRLRDILQQQRQLFRPANDLQAALGRVAIVADAAHSLGAERDGWRSGQAADFTCFSFHAVKNLTTAEGGAVTWLPIDGFEDEVIYNEYMLLSLHGQNKDAMHKNRAGAWEYDIIYPAYKCNMTDLCAALGSSQLKRYKDILKRRHQILNRYNEGLADCQVGWLEHESETSYSSAHLYLLRVLGRGINRRNQIINQLGEEGIACNVHYKPLPMMTAYRNLGFNIADFPEAYKLYSEELTLPLHTCLDDDDVTRIIETLHPLLKK